MKVKLRLEELSEELSALRIEVNPERKLWRSAKYPMHIFLILGALQLFASATLAALQL